MLYDHWLHTSYLNDFSPSLVKWVSAKQGREEFISSFFNWYKLFMHLLFISLSYAVFNLSFLLHITIKVNKSKLPPKPYLENAYHLVMGEVHKKHGEQVEKPWWLLIPWKGLVGNLFILGGIGLGKTAGAMFPFARDLLHQFSQDPVLKIGGFFLDIKGNFYKKVKQFLSEVDRLKDLLVIDINAVFHWNPVYTKKHVPADKIATLLLGVLVNFSGEQKGDPFWLETAHKFIEQIINMLRLKEGYFTLKDIYRLSYDEDRILDILATFNPKNEEEEEIFEDVRFFFEKGEWNVDAKVKSIVLSEVSRMTYPFTKGVLKKMFCPERDEINFWGFEDCLEKGKIVIFNLREKSVGLGARIAGIICKMSFQEMVLNRVEALEQGRITNKDRLLLFFCDEYQNFVTDAKGGLTGDAEFYSLARESLCCSICSSQSYSTMLKYLGNNEAAVETILQAFHSKVFLGTEDNKTGDFAERLCDKVMVERESRSVSDTAFNARFSFLAGKFMGGKKNVSEQVTYTNQRDFLFPSADFKNLSAYQSITVTFDGTDKIGPQVVYMKPYYLETQESWFDQHKRKFELK